MYRKVVQLASRNFCSRKPDNHFGFKDIATESKQSLVNEVFHSVANKYDLMNDAMSMGIHRYWKNQFVNELGNLSPFVLNGGQQTARILDVAGGTGDISFRILDNHNHKSIYHFTKTLRQLYLISINQCLTKEPLRPNKWDSNNHFICGNAEELPFPDNTFDAYTISFGLRNVPRTKKALEQAKRVLKKGGRFMCLEFSKVVNPVFREIYRQYSFLVIPEMGRVLTGDKDSYQYLIESIERFLSQEQLRKMMQEVGFENPTYTNMTNGIVAIHSGFKLQ